MHPASRLHAISETHERVERIDAIDAALRSDHGMSISFEESPLACPEDLALVHTSAHVRFVQECCAAGPRVLAGDNTRTAGPGSLEAALRAAGGAGRVVDAALAERRAVAASLHRPPGHHATRNRVMGYCLFNNVALGAAREVVPAVVEVRGGGPVMVS